MEIYNCDPKRSDTKKDEVGSGVNIINRKKLEWGSRTNNKQV